jgi:hypothetical protein
MPRRSRIDAPGAMHHVIVKTGDSTCIVNFLAEEGRSGCSILFFYLNPITAAQIDHINPRSFGVCTSGVYDYGYYGPAVQLGCVCPVDDRTSCICSAKSD